MERYPLLTIDKSKLAHNARAAIELCGRMNIEPVAVTKLFQGDPQIARILAENGIKYFGDSRIQNLIRLKDVPGNKALIRIPMRNEIDQLVEYADMSLNSELDTIRAISDYSIAHNKKHQVVLMVDMGDRREGVLEKDLDETVQGILECKGVELIGLGVNFGCYGGIIPDSAVMARFIAHKAELEQKYHIKLPHISGGNSLTLHMIWEGLLPEGVTHLRLGQSINLGVEDKYGAVMEGFKGDVYMLHAQVVEKKTKSSVPEGQIGIDAFGNVPVFEDRGDIRRLILGIGKQDMYFDGLTPLDEGVKIIGGSSDHMILDVTEAKREFEVGDILTFSMSYSSILMGMNSEYVYKKFV